MASIDIIEQTDWSYLDQSLDSLEDKIYPLMASPDCPDELKEAYRDFVWKLSEHLIGRGEDVMNLVIALCTEKPKK